MVFLGWWDWIPEGGCKRRVRRVRRRTGGWPRCTSRNWRPRCRCAPVAWRGPSPPGRADATSSAPRRSRQSRTRWTRRRSRPGSDRGTWRRCAASTKASQIATKKKRYFLFFSFFFNFFLNFLNFLNFFCIRRTLVVKRVLLHIHIYYSLLSILLFFFFLFFILFFYFLIIKLTRVFACCLSHCFVILYIEHTRKFYT